ncbi:MAG: hypothetical protein SFW64_01100 [Alphaproteobacteria bacterium]|nr:hypothetical protein [Alphaproteobacteria bacterium]
MRASSFSFGLLAALLAYGTTAQAGPTCAAGATVPVQNYPGASAIVPGNNLLLPAGKAVEAAGQKIILHGQVLDTRCAPVQEAVVELWQNGPTGRWLLAGRDDLASANPVFAGAGRTYTDSEGRFSFITAFPAPLEKRAPFVNIKISGKGLPTVKTALFFSDDARNATDDAYRKLGEKPREDVTIRMRGEEDGALQGDIVLVIPGTMPFQTY